MKAGADGALGEKPPRLLVHFDHHRHVMDFRGTAQVIEVMQVIGTVFPDEFNIVIQARTTDGLDDGWPGSVDMGSQGRLVPLE